MSAPGRSFAFLPEAAGRRRSKKRKAIGSRPLSWVCATILAWNLFTYSRTVSGQEKFNLFRIDLFNAFGGCLDREKLRSGFEPRIGIGDVVHRACALVQSPKSRLGTRRRNVVHVHKKACSKLFSGTVKRKHVVVGVWVVSHFLFFGKVVHLRKSLFSGVPVFNREIR
jgi:hypothetical protein